MSKSSLRDALMILALLLGAAAVLQVSTPTAAMACSDPPCRAR
jgi:hypothetical protein